MIYTKVFWRFKGTPWVETFSFLSIFKFNLYEAIKPTDFNYKYKKSKKNNNFQAPKKSDIVIFPGRIYCHVNKTSQQYTTFYTTYSHVLDGEIKTISANWCLIVRTWGDTPATLIVCPMLGRRNQHVAQCCRNIQPSFSKCLGIQKVFCVLSGFIEM